MKSQSISLTLLDENKSPQARIELKLREIAVGPVHNDLPLISKKEVIHCKKGYLGRLAFDIVMSQEVHFIVEVSKMAFRLNRDLEVSDD